MGKADIASPSSDLLDAYNKGHLIATSHFAGAAQLFLGTGAVAGQNTKEHPGSSSSCSSGAVSRACPADLHSAVRRGEADAVSKLLSEGADAASLDGSGRSALLLATQEGHLPVVRVLLDGGAGDAACIPPNGPNGMSALVKAAARKEHLGILRALIARGADVEAADSGGATSLQHAAMLGKTESINVLVEHGASVDSVDVDGMSALHWASIEGHGEAIVALLRHGADIDAADSAGRTPLHRACAVDDTHTTEAAELLLLWGADDKAVDDEGHTPDHYAKARRGGQGGGGAKQRALESLLQLLGTTSSDRAWCRHGLVILCKARLGHGAVGTVLDRLVTLEEEELFEKSWAAEADDDDGDDQEKTQEVERKRRDSPPPVQQKGEEPIQKKEEPSQRGRREEEQARSSQKEEDPQASVGPKQLKRLDNTWIKPQRTEQAPQTTRVEPQTREGKAQQDSKWIKPQRTEQAPQTRVDPRKREGEEKRGHWRGSPPEGGMRGTKQNRGEQPGSPEFSRSYALGKKLGEGAFAETFGAIRRGQRKGWQGSCIVKRAVQRGASHEVKHGLVEEARILRLLTHPSVVTVQEVFSDSPDYFYLVLEHLAGGPVFDRIVTKTRFRESDARHLCRTLVLCVQHCHDMGIVHRDLRPEQLLLTSRNEDATIKLTGFDFARSLPREGSDGRRRGKRGLLVAESYVTAEYAAPEVLSSVPHGTAVDMWSMGVIFYTLLGGYHPFHDERQPRLFRRIRDGSFVFHDELWSNTSDQAKDFVRRLLVVDATKRMTAKQALQHPWILGSEKDLAKNDLSFNQEQLRVFNATAKLRAAIKSVMATRRELSS
ncbi:unnamed protein product [Ectocarpus sp. 12 AP-2014]